MAGVGIRIEANVDEAAAVLQRIVARGFSPAPALDEIGSYLVSSTIRRFELERGPDGTPWKKSRRAERESGQTLTDTGRLRASITHSVAGDAVEVGTNVVYAAIHQFGGKTKPRTIRPRRKKALFWPGAGHPVASVQHPGSDVPARPFLGVDDRDRPVIERIVVRHLEGL